ncbi:hypothetical protein Tco_1267555 [Tanacetum coccineum]
MLRSRAQLAPESLRGIFIEIMLYRVMLVKKLILGLVKGGTNSYVEADMLLYSWDGGLDVCVDVKGSSPLTPRMIDFVPGRAVIKVAQRKRTKYEAKCVDIGYGILHFPFSSFGELEKD